jgi:uncharacterized membrane protein YccC
MGFTDDTERKRRSDEHDEEKIKQVRTSQRRKSSERGRFETKKVNIGVMGNSFHLRISFSLFCTS